MHKLALLLTLASSLTGCATYETLSTGAPDGGSGWWSGTKYNIALLDGSFEALMPYTACEPPPYPAAVDLPLSFAADTAVVVAKLFALQAAGNYIYEKRNDPHQGS